MLQFLIILTILVCVLLTLVILAQNSKGGLSTGMSGASQVMGAKRSTETIEKATWVLGALLFVFSFSAGLISNSGESTQIDGFESPNVERAKESGGININAGAGESVDEELQEEVSTDELFNDEESSFEEGK